MPNNGIRFSRRKFLRLGSAAAVVAVMAGVGGYLAYQSAQTPGALSPKVPVTLTTNTTIDTYAPPPTRTVTPPTTTIAPNAGRTRRVPELYHTIKEALDVASEGDTIQVGPGTYPGFDVAPYEAKPLAVKGSGVGVTIIDGFLTDSSLPTIRLNSSRVSLTGFTVKGGSHACVIMEGAGGNEVSGNTFESPTGDSVHIHTGNNKVSNNIMKTAGAGVANHAEIGAYPHGGINNKIVANSIEAGDIGVIINVGDNNEVRGNTIKHCATGIIISPFRQLTEGNTIFENNLVDNKIQAQDDGSNNVWYKDGKGNYWSDWTSPDDDKDGIVDKPYVIAGTAKSLNKYPLASPYQP